jgi:hypothetical protein
MKIRIFGYITWVILIILNLTFGDPFLFGAFLVNTFFLLKDAIDSIVCEIKRG